MFAAVTRATRIPLLPPLEVPLLPPDEPPLLDELGLGPALQAFVDEQRKLSPALGFAIVLLNFLPVSYFVTTSHTFQ